MGNEYLIDTNAVIDYLDNKLPDKAGEIMDGIDSGISVITRMGLLSWPGTEPAGYCLFLASSLLRWFLFVDCR